MPAYICTRGEAAEYARRRPDHFLVTDRWGRPWVCFEGTPGQPHAEVFRAAVCGGLAGYQLGEFREVRVVEVRDRTRLASMLSSGIPALN